MSKKRHIRWDRLFLVLALTAGVSYSIGVGAYKLITKLTAPEETKEVRINMDTFEQWVELTSWETKNLKSSGSSVIIEKLPRLLEVKDLGEFQLTGYCSCEECCGEWSGGPCYNGEMPVAEWTVAVDPDVIPLNSYIWINGHRYKTMDTGSAINEKHIDIYCNSHEECFSEFCNGYAEVYLEV